MPHPDERQPSWWLDPPDDPEPETDLQAEAEQRQIDRNGEFIAGLQLEPESGS